MIDWMGDVVGFALSWQWVPWAIWIGVLLFFGICAAQDDGPWD